MLQIEPNIHRKQDIFVAKSEVYFENKFSLVEISSEANHFFELSPGSPWNCGFEPEDPVLSSMYFRSGSKNRVYSHDPYKFLDFLGDIGGFLEIGYAFGLILTMSFVKDSFMRSILSDTYQV